MSLITALLLSVFIAVIITENYGYGYWMISRPIFAGPLVGLILGDVQTGLIVGGSVELMYMGILPIGGSVPPNAQIAGMLSTVFAIQNGGNPEVGITLALPIGMLAQLLIMFAWNINILLMHRADKYLANGETRKVELTHLSGLLIFFVVFFIPSFLAVYYGSGFVNDVVAGMPALLMDGMKVASGILPAVGMAMLLKMMNMKKFWPLFMLGFVLATYLELAVLPISLIGFSIAASLFLLNKKDKEADDEFVLDDDDVVEEDTQPGILTKKELRQTFVRSFFSMTSINYERYCSLGFAFAMIPALKKLYTDQDELNEALIRHNEFFNCHPYTGNAVLGVALALEEQRAMGKPITAEAISSTKATFMTVFAAIGAGLALDGSILGPIIFIVPNIILNVGSRWYFIKYGHKLGTSIVSKMKQGNLLDKFVEGATIVGMMVVGAMIVGFVKMPVAFVWNFGEKEIIVQELLDAILPCMLPLLITLGFYQILVKNKKGMYICVIGSFVIGILGKAIGMF